MRGCPCQNCLDREIGCHGTCEKYKDWAGENEKVKHRRILDSEVFNYRKEEHYRIEKYIRTKRR